MTFKTKLFKDSLNGTIEFVVKFEQNECLSEAVFFNLFNLFKKENSCHQKHCMLNTAGEDYDNPNWMKKKLGILITFNEV